MNEIQLKEFALMILRAQFKTYDKIRIGEKSYNEYDFNESDILRIVTDKDTLVTRIDYAVGENDILSVNVEVPSASVTDLTTGKTYKEKKNDLSIVHSGPTIK